MAITIGRYSQLPVSASSCPRASLKFAKGYTASWKCLGINSYIPTLATISSHQSRTDGNWWINTPAPSALRWNDSEGHVLCSAPASSSGTEPQLPKPVTCSWVHLYGLPSLLSHIPKPPLVPPGVTSRLNHLPMSPWVSIFWGNPSEDNCIPWQEFRIHIECEVLRSGVNNGMENFP